MRRLLVVLLVLVALFVGLDRLAAYGAERVVAQRLQSSEGLAAPPDVRIAGFPFLTQAFAGDYRSVSASVRDLRRDGLTVSRVTVHLDGVHVPLSSVLHQSVSRLPVDRADGQVLVTYADINAFLAGRGLTVAPALGGQVHITGSAGPLRVSVDVAPRVAGDSVVLAGGGVSVALQLPQLPFHVQLTGVQATSSGLLVAASAHDLVLRIG